MVLRIFFLAIAALFWSSPVQATKLDTIIGIRVAQFGTQTILASPPLPSLDGKQEHKLIPYAAYTRAKTKNEGTTQDSFIKESFEGRFEGWGAGVGFTEETKRNLSFYGFGVGTQLNGNIVGKNSYTNNGQETAYTFTLRDIENSSMNFAGGVHLRTWSDRQFPFGFGVFGGPLISNFRTKFKFDRYDYSANSFVYGAHYGAQAFFQFFWFKLNPYIIYYKDLSDPCQAYTTTNDADQRGTPDTEDACANAQSRHITLEGSFSAYGLNVGFMNLNLNVYTHIQKHPSLSAIQVNNYALSYTFKF